MAEVFNIFFCSYTKTNFHNIPAVNIYCSKTSKVQTLILSLARPFADALLRNVVRS